MRKKKIVRVALGVALLGVMSVAALTAVAPSARQIDGEAARIAKLEHELELARTAAAIDPSTLLDAVRSETRRLANVTRLKHSLDILGAKDDAELLQMLDAVEANQPATLLLARAAGAIKQLKKENEALGEQVRSGVVGYREVAVTDVSRAYALAPPNLYLSVERLPNQPGPVRVHYGETSTFMNVGQTHAIVVGRNACRLTLLERQTEQVRFAFGCEAAAAPRAVSAGLNIGG